MTGIQQLLIGAINGVHLMGVSLIAYGWGQVLFGWQAPSLEQTAAWAADLLTLISVLFLALSIYLSPHTRLPTA